MKRCPLSKCQRIIYIYSIRLIMTHLYVAREDIVKGANQWIFPFYTLHLTHSELPLTLSSMIYLFKQLRCRSLLGISALVWYAWSFCVLLQFTTTTTYYFPLSLFYMGYSNIHMRFFTHAISGQIHCIIKFNFISVDVEK